MKYSTDKLLALIAIFIIYCFSFSTAGYAYDQFIIKNVDMLGGINGNICNKTNKYFDYLFIKVIAVNHRGKELWTQAVPIDAIGPRKCIKFFKRTSHPGNQYKFKFSYYPSKTSELFRVNNRDNDISLYNTKLEGRNVMAKVCNKSSSTYKDFIVGILAIKRNKSVLWKGNSIITELSPGKCKNISQYVYKAVQEEPSNYLYSINKLTSNTNIEFGKINDKISYKDVSVGHHSFSGMICNDAKKLLTDAFINFYAFSSQGDLMWDDWIAIDNIESGQCKSFSENLLYNDVPTTWKFTTSTWFEYIE